jgi:WD40 repeat protein
MVGHFEDVIFRDTTCFTSVNLFPLLVEKISTVRKQFIVMTSPDKGSKTHDTITLLDLTTKQTIYQLPPLKSQIILTKVLSGGRIAIITSEDLLLLWYPRAHQVKTICNVRDYYLYSIGELSKTQIIMIGKNSRLIVWDLNSFSVIKTISTTSQLTCLDVYDSNTIVAITLNHYIEVWDIQNGVRKLAFDRREQTQIKVHGEYAYSYFKSWAVIMKWKLHTGEKVSDFSMYNQSYTTVDSFKIMKDGCVMLYSSEGLFKLVETFASTFTLLKSHVSDAVELDDGTVVVQREKKLQQWDFKNQKMLKAVRSHLKTRLDVIYL